MSNLIDRQAAIDEIQSVYDFEYPTASGAFDEFVTMIIPNIIKNMPSAQPERRKGKWIVHKFSSNAQCSECGMHFNDVYDMDNCDKYCRHCGTQMEGLKVVDDE